MKIQNFNFLTKTVAEILQIQKRIKYWPRICRPELKYAIFSLIYKVLYSEIEEQIVTLRIYWKNNFGVSKFWATILNLFFCYLKIYCNSGSINPKSMFVFSETIHHGEPSSFYLPNMKKYSGAYQIIQRKLASK